MIPEAIPVEVILEQRGHRERSRNGFTMDLFWDFWWSWEMYMRSHRTVKAALKRIESQNYKALFTAKGIPEEKIRKYGFAFCGKKVLIGK